MRFGVLRTFGFVMEGFTTIVLAYWIAKSKNKLERAFIVLWLIGWAMVWFAPVYSDAGLLAVRYANVLVWVVATVIALRITKAPNARRHCHQLVYASQREQFHDRALRKAQAIRMKLGGSASFFEPFPDKPKGMHWSTCQHLFFEAEIAAWHSLPPWFLRRLEADS